MLLIALNLSLRVVDFSSRNNFCSLFFFSYIGGDYSVIRRLPTVGTYSRDPVISCVSGDTITFTINNSAVFFPHPIALITGAFSTLAPKYVGTLSGPNPMAAVGSLTLTYVITVIDN